MVTRILHQIGPRDFGGNFNPLDEIIACEDSLSFDGVYESVYKHYTALIGKDITFFFSGNLLGKDNSFDEGQPLSKFCNYAQLLEMANYLDADIGYHGYNHLRCPVLSKGQLEAEIEPPHWLKDFCKNRGAPLTLAWPYGDVDEDCITMAKKLGYDLAYSVYPKHFSHSRYAIERRFLNWDHHDSEGNIILRQNPQ